MTQQQKKGNRLRETTTKSKTKSQIFNYTWWLREEGYANSTIKGYKEILETIKRRNGNLFEPESVKKVIAKQESWSSGRKNNAVKAYTLFLKMHGGTWNPPKYRRIEKLPFIPTEDEIDNLISGCSLKIAAFLQLLKETGIRCGEAYQLKQEDIDTIENTVRITPEKFSNPRIFKISNRLVTMLGNLDNNSENIFGYSSKTSLRRTFEKQKKRLAKKLGNLRLLQISFHTFRHWKATTEYAKTKDILYVMQILGHKRIKNTLKYVQLAETLHDNEEYVCRVASTVKQASQLIESGFEYVCDIDSAKLFRRRK